MMRFNRHYTSNESTW